MPNFEDALDAVEKEYENQKPTSEDYMDPGTYQFRVEDVELTTFEKDGVPIPTAVVAFTCLDDKYLNRTTKQFFRFGTPFSVSLWKELLKILGQDPNTPLKELETIIPDMKGCVITASLKNNTSQGRVFTNLTPTQMTGREEMPPI